MSKEKPREYITDEEKRRLDFWEQRKLNERRERNNNLRAISHWLERMEHYLEVLSEK